MCYKLYLEGEELMKSRDENALVEGEEILLKPQDENALVEGEYILWYITK